MFSIGRLEAGVPYHDDVIKWLDDLAPGLHADLAKSAILPADVTKSIVDRAVELACQCQNVMNIEIGWFILSTLPVTAVESHLEDVSKTRLDWGDGYEILRLLEVAEALGPSDLSWVVERRLNSDDPEVREAAEEWRQDS